MSHCRDCNTKKNHKMMGGLQNVKYSLFVVVFLNLFVSVILFIPGVNSAEKVARIDFSPKESLVLERLDPIPLLCRQGPFYLEIPITRLSWVKVIKRKGLELRFRGGGVCVAQAPKLPITGEWSHGPVKQDWGTFSRIEILNPPQLRKSKPNDRLAIIRAGKQGVMQNVWLRKDKPLKIRKGEFLINIPWDRIDRIKQIDSSKVAKVLFLDGEVLEGILPEYVEGDWQGASLRVSGLEIKSIKLLEQIGKSKIKEREKKAVIKRRSKERVWGLITGDSGVRFDIIGPPEFNGPFSFWNEIRQARNRSYLPLAQNLSDKDERTILIAAHLIRKIEKSGSRNFVRYEVTLQSGSRYSGWVGSHKVSAKSLKGRIEIPLSRITRIAQTSMVERPPHPPTFRAVVHLVKGENIEVEEPALFYVRKLRANWKESGSTWTGGHTKSFLFVRLGSTVQRVSFSRLKRMEIPIGAKDEFGFFNRNGTRLRLSVDWERHREVEDLGGIEQVHPTGKAYMLDHIGLVGRIEPGVLVYIPWHRIKVVIFASTTIKRSGSNIKSSNARSLKQ